MFFNTNYIWILLRYVRYVQVEIGLTSLQFFLKEYIALTKILDMTKHEQNNYTGINS